VQLGLVVFDGEHVVAAPRQHSRADVLLAEHGVAGDDLAFQRQDAQQFQGGLVLIGLGIDAQLADDGSYLGGVGRQQVNAGDPLTGGAPQGLAIQGQRRAQLRAPGHHPTGQGLFVGIDVKLAEEGGQGAFARRVQAGEAQGEPEGQPVVAGELSDGFQAAHASEQGHGGEAEDSHEGMPSATTLARVGDGSEDFLQGRRGSSWHKKTPMS
jgi:hypothetical protein